MNIEIGSNICNLYGLIHINILIFEFSIA